MGGGGGCEREKEVNLKATFVIPWQISGIQNLLRANLVEPEEADIMHELHRHREIMLY